MHLESMAFCFFALSLHTTFTKPTGEDQRDIHKGEQVSRRKDLFVIARVYDTRHKGYPFRQKQDTLSGVTVADNDENEHNVSVEQRNGSHSNNNNITNKDLIINEASSTLNPKKSNNNKNGPNLPTVETTTTNTIHRKKKDEEQPPPYHELETTTITTPTEKTTVEPSATKCPKECQCSRDQLNNNKKESLDAIFNFKPSVTSLSNDQLHYQLADYVIKFVFKHYPELQIPLLTKLLANGTSHQAYSGMIMEFQQPNSFDILVTDPYSQVHDGTKKKLEQYPSLYQCSKAIRYCSINPKFCQYQEGDYDTNIIITVPHGGEFKPENLKERTTGCYDNGKCVYMHNCDKYGGVRSKEKCGIETHPNANSRDIAIMLADQIKNVTGQRPHVIIMELHHSLIDVDAFENEGTFGDEEMQRTWYDFHNFISIARQKIPGQGLLLDIHTHTQTHGLVELGYAVPKSQLESDNVDLSKSSIKSLVERSDLLSEDILRGRYSLGYLLQTNYVEAFPSVAFPKPDFELSEDRQPIVELYGSSYGGLIDAIRISTPKKYYSKGDVNEYTMILSRALKTFLNLTHV